MIYEVWPNGHSPQDGMTILEAVDHEDAARQYGEREDAESADYTIVRGMPEIVSVRAINADEIKVLIVSGETVNKYSAKPLTF